MDSYKKAIEFYANNRENTEFGNKGAEHAAIVVTNLIRIAQSELRIYSGNLSSEVANDRFLVKQLNRFLESGKKLMLILDELPAVEKQSAALKEILSSVDNPRRNVNYKIDTDGVFKDIQKKEFKDGNFHHFIVADDNAYRFETDTANFRAFGNFNDKKIASLLINVFDIAFKKL